MISISIHGRDYSQAILASQILALAYIEQGYCAQAFSNSTKHRLGDVAISFVRASKRVIKTKAPIEQADYGIIMEQNVITNQKVLESIKKEGIIIVNSEESIVIPERQNIFCVNLDKTADIISAELKYIGMLGAFAGITTRMQVKSLLKVIEERMPNNKSENTKRLAEKIYEIVRKEVISK